MLLHWRLLKDTEKYMNNLDNNNQLTDESASEYSSDRLLKRQKKEKRFQLLGKLSVLASVSFLFILFISIIDKGSSAIRQSEVLLSIDLSTENFRQEALMDPKKLRGSELNKLIRNSLIKLFPNVQSRSDRRMLYSLISSGARHELRDRIVQNRDLIGGIRSIWLPLSDDADMFLKGNIKKDVPSNLRKFKDNQISWLDQLMSDGLVRKSFNSRFFTNGDSREPEIAGTLGALIGSFFTLIVTFLISFPIGVMAAIYLEEFAPKNRFTEIIEVNINNLAAVPSIVFGLLGLGVFISFFDFPRSAPLVGGMVLSLMTLPTIIIVSRASLKAVPGSIREAALGLGASKMQTVLHHVLPLGMPGILTGAILGMARALGETAPLLMIGMVAFIVDIPKKIDDPSTALPVQIFLWADSPERAFVERTSAAIMLLLFFLLTMNFIAVLLRQKFEKRW